MISIECDEMNDQFYFHCHECGKEGRNWDRERDAGLDADRHEELCAEWS